MKTISSEQKPNLTIMDNSIVHKLIIEDKKCVGVKVGNSNRLRKSQKSTDIFTNGEVVLSAGAFISPALLQLRYILKNEEDDLKLLVKSYNEFDHIPYSELYLDILGKLMDF